MSLPSVLIKLATTLDTCAPMSLHCTLRAGKSAGKTPHSAMINRLAVGNNHYLITANFNITRRTIAGPGARSPNRSTSSSARRRGFQSFRAPLRGRHISGMTGLRQRDGRISARDSRRAVNTLITEFSVNDNTADGRRRPSTRRAVTLSTRPLAIIRQPAKAAALKHIRSGEPRQLRSAVRVRQISRRMIISGS